MTRPGSRNNLAFVIGLVSAMWFQSCFSARGVQAADDIYDFPTRSPIADLVCRVRFIDRDGKQKERRDHLLAKGAVHLPANSDVEVLLRFDALEAMQYLDQLSRAHVIVLQAASLDLEDSHLIHLKNYQSLHYLNLDTTLITDKSLPVIAGLKSIFDLRLSGTNIKGTGFDNLNRLPNLRMLNISSLTLDKGTLSKLKPLVSHLSDLTLARTELNKEELASLGPMPAIEHLDIAFNHKLDDSCASQLAHLTKLKQLAINDTGITDKSLPILVKLPNLTQVTVRGRDFWRTSLAKKEIGHIKFVDVAAKSSVPVDVWEPLH